MNAAGKGDEKGESEWKQEQTVVTITTAALMHGRENVPSTVLNIMYAFTFNALSCLSSLQFCRLGHSPSAGISRSLWPSWWQQSPALSPGPVATCHLPLFWELIERLQHVTRCSFVLFLVWVMREKKAKMFPAQMNSWPSVSQIGRVSEVFGPQQEPLSEIS